MSTPQSKQGHSQETIDIQNQIEVYTKKIEHEKINLRLYSERHNNLKEQLQRLQNKKFPSKKKRSKSKNREPLYKKPNQTKEEKANNDQDLLIKDVNKKYYDLERYRSEVNKIILENRFLKTQIESLRKEKVGADGVLDRVNKKCDDLGIELERIIKSNDYNERSENGLLKLYENELNKVEVDGPKENEIFIKSRDKLEEDYLNIIGENIKREREHMKEVFKKANAQALSITKKDDEVVKSIKDEEISDRTPVLDIQIEKWKYFNKYMKNMLEKYNRNAVSLKEALERIMNYLGVETYDDIPILLDKYEEQMSSIEMFLSKLTITQFSLEEQRNFIDMKIKQLESRFSMGMIEKNEYVKQRKERIQMIKTQIQEFKESIKEKEELFTMIKQPTDEFLSEMERTYVSDYIPIRVPINKEEYYNENNILEVLANVQDYLSVTEGFNKILNSKESIEEKVTDKEMVNLNTQINKELERLRFEMKNKIDSLKSTSQLKNSIKDKTNIPFNEAIKKISEEIVKGYVHSNKVYDKESSLKKNKK